jgi:hypothetical protein
MATLFALMGYVNPIAVNCYKGLSTTLTASTFTNILVGDTLLENVLYNAGYIFTDILDISTNDPSTVGNWPYYLAYQMGDFVVRFLY